MGFFSRRERPLPHLARNLYLVVGVVLIWRGVWYVLDVLDEVLFGGSHWVTAVLGVAVGFALLYLPERRIDVLP